MIYQCQVLKSCKNPAVTEIAWIPPRYRQSITDYKDWIWYAQRKAACRECAIYLADCDKAWTLIRKD